MQTTPEAFKDFEIHIAPKGEGVYRVTLRRQGGGECSGDFSTGGLPPWESSSNPVEYGKQLFAALFADQDLRDVWVEARAQPQRRIRLWIEPEAAELHSLPWELLRDGDVWLATDDNTPFSRFLPVRMPWRGPLTAYPIRVLVAISDPGKSSSFNLAPIDVAKEQALVREGFASFLPPKYKGSRKIIDLAFLEAPVTLESLNKALSDGEGYHVLHFVGHGSFSEERKQAALFCRTMTATQSWSKMKRLPTRSGNKERNARTWSFWQPVTARRAARWMPLPGWGRS